MQLVVQCVLEASVTVQHQPVAAIGPGLLVLVGFEPSDTEAALPAVAKELVALRVFDDEKGRLGRSLSETGGEVLLVSQITLASAFKGLRPSFDTAAPPESARMLFQSFAQHVHAVHPRVQTGVFQAHMVVRLTNDGPVTFVLSR